MPRSRLARLAALALGLVVSACAGSTPKPLLPDPGPDGVYSVDWPALGRGEDRYITIELGPDSLATCRRVSPKFPFDSARAQAQDQAQIVALASCLNNPVMADRSVLLVGRADARGSDAHNLELGQKRAAFIKDLLVKNGLAESRIRVTTAGESAAVGGGPDFSHGYDRRVDVVVVGGEHRP